MNICVASAMPLFYSFMPLSFRQVHAAPIVDFEATAPEGSIIGLIGEDGSGKTRLLRASRQASTRLNREW